MIDFAHTVYIIVIWLFLIYSAAVFLVYSWIGIYAFGAVRRYKNENTFTDYGIIASNPNAPTFSLIAPAYNEGLTIVDNVRSLLSLYYHNLEIIIVNDGSKDDSITKLIAAYDLERVSFFVQGTIETKPVKGIYKSKNPAFKKLLVVDKENGGKADALNVGINVSSGEYMVCIDVDCILEQDAILKLAKPFLEQTDKRLIACGGVIRLANNCKIENGKVVSVNLPKSRLGRAQALEYIRAFVLGRMAWSRASGLILISGAFGAFDREIVLKCGGYDTATVGEDMELVVRMRRFMEEAKEPYEVVNIPEPLCWTEVPESKDILSRQRNRWMRGTMETLWKHRKLMFNPKYGKLGMVSLPYWFLFEFLGPLVEFSGYVVFLIFLLLGIVNWPFFFVLFALVISTGILYSVYAVLVDLVGRQVYTKRKDFLTLIATAVAEPFYFHPLTVKAGVSGFIDYFKKSHSWGEMTRQGFSQSAKQLSPKQKITMFFTAGLKKWGLIAAAFSVMYLISVFVEWIWYKNSFNDMDTVFVIKYLFISNTIFLFKLLSVLGVLYFILRLLKEKIANFFIIVAAALIIVSQYGLFLYFAETKNILGADLFYYSSAEIHQILRSSGMLNVKNVALLLLLAAATAIPLFMVTKYSFKSWYAGAVFIIIGFILMVIPVHKFQVGFISNEFQQNAAKSKLSYFIGSYSENYISGHPELFQWLYPNVEAAIDSNNFDDKYPFLKEEDTADFLGSYFNKSDEIPNIVVVIVEGLGHAYSSPNGYVGSFTPFIDSLSGKSLYWDFNLSSSGRTFGALPTIAGSLPFGKSGFLEIEETPQHYNLFNVLKYNGFETGFFYGGNISFDRMDKFLEYSKVDHITDQASFGDKYQKLPQSNGESWGYEDQAVFTKMLDVQKEGNEPYFNMILTLSTHNPFLINNTAYYENRFDEQVKSNRITNSQKNWALQYKKQLVTVMNLDHALEKFFNTYKKRSDFANTIFIITGDHSMPEIPLQEKIDRYRVPLIIYSPLLKQSQRFTNIVSHFDIAPSLLAYYRTNYNLKTPAKVAWFGNGLKGTVEMTGKRFPLMQSKDQIADFISGSYHLNQNNLYALKTNNEELIENEVTKNKITKQFNNFKQKNNTFYSSQKLIPDSLIVEFFSNNK
ncbi:Glycosyltransferase, catalytic subunit of cellulose synthase and poly-beta-1,6-N-acetylglucosamine synthase [Paenimyroides ummariense]|uniref:Glycosyltransferase, catalytic subunit of cellulose synthase and poly-beta-1,6-N-acetylglucosamine synthase n=1 Tax=Paenimyroides ummariense TaxID=913024 RepID=A0A1I4Z4U5_9FLAO|nr:sulfatase-like hydrolase/transferase [Paenimyroides ummariense]SFN45316.1 Glycosyltransferase, catalytic subunit of cellulose synthase and poly-beta-1,6-N-acetylglucosamine synthase [Paenimyroides ummariense]